jgi:hypothetical protein
MFRVQDLMTWARMSLETPMNPGFPRVRTSQSKQWLRVTDRVTTSQSKQWLRVTDLVMMSKSKCLHSGDGVVFLEHVSDEAGFFLFAVVLA